MENAEEILQCLDEFAKLRPKEIPPELEYYLSFVARTGDPVYQWPLIKCLFREKLINVVTEFYEACPSVEIPPCPNVEIFNYEAMKGFILEKLDTFAAAPFTVQRICELLTAPRKEYNRIDKYMRALEKNILVVSTREPGSRKTENGESIVNGLEADHETETEMNSINSEINVEVDLEEKTVWHKNYETTTSSLQIQESFVSESKTESVITSRHYIGYTNEIITTTTEAETDPVTDPITDPTDTIPDSESNNQSVDQNLDHVEQVDPIIHSETSKEEPIPEIFVTESVKPEAETEPITPPEPETSENPETSEITEIPPPKIEETPEKPSSESSAIEEISSSVEPEPSEIITEIADIAEITENPENPESSDISDISDEQKVTESVVIGPEDMQVEDISPEPDTPPVTTTITTSATISSKQPEVTETEIPQKTPDESGESAL